MKKVFKKHIVTVILALISISSGYSQIETAKWKALIATGINSPSQNGFITSWTGKSINFPTINLGLQRMFKPQLGAKLDFNFNRFSATNNTITNKINYTRINAQFVYDATPVLRFLPKDLALVTHVGPGYSMITPLGNYKENKTAFLNAMVGIEIHHYITRTLTAYIDASYIYGFSSNFSPINTGIGSFNGNLFTISIGVAISLSGCVTC